MSALETVLCVAFAAKAFVAGLGAGLAYGPDDDHASLPDVCRHCGCKRQPNGLCKHCDHGREPDEGDHGD